MDAAQIAISAISAWIDAHFNLICALVVLTVLAVALFRRSKETYIDFRLRGFSRSASFFRGISYGGFVILGILVFGAAIWYSGKLKVWWLILIFGAVYILAFGFLGKWYDKKPKGKEVGQVEKPPVR